MTALSFEIHRRASANRARLGRVTTIHGSFDTPAFMPVGTQGTVKGILPHLVAELGAQIILANTFHLMLRPGSDLVAEMGGGEGLHHWMRWPGPILTDSGGFQVFSLADINQITNDGVTFRSPHDGRSVHLTPERSIAVQNELGADIIMAFDDCPPAFDDRTDPTPLPLREGHGEDGVNHLDDGPESDVDSKEGSGSQTETGDAPTIGDPTLPPPLPKRKGSKSAHLARVRSATERSIRWLDRCVKAHARPHDQSLFGIVQGGTDLDLRTRCAQAVCQHNLPGFAIGGVAVGEGFDEMKRVVEHTAPLLPDEKPRYLMGVGYERDILTAVQAGVDMFDCVLPTRNGRNANAFTPAGQMRLKNAKYARDPRPIDETCDCAACAGVPSSKFQVPGSKPNAAGSQLGTCNMELGKTGFSRSYLRHLFMAGEMLGPILVTLHNLRHFQRFMLDIRRAITDDDWSGLLARWPVAAGRMKQ